MSFCNDFRVILPSCTHLRHHSLNWFPNSKTKHPYEQPIWNMAFRISSRPRRFSDYWTENYLPWEGISPALAISHVLTTHKYHIFSCNEGSGLILVLPYIWRTPCSCFLLEYSSFLELSSAAFLSPHFNMLAKDNSFHTTPTFFASLFILACYHFHLGHRHFS